MTNEERELAKEAKELFNGWVTGKGLMIDRMRDVLMQLAGPPPEEEENPITTRKQMNQLMRDSRKLTLEQILERCRQLAANGECCASLYTDLAEDVAPALRELGYHVSTVQPTPNTGGMVLINWDWIV